MVLGQALQKRLGQGALVEVFADKDKGVAAGFRPPRPGDVPAEKLVDTLQEVFFFHPADGEEAFEAVKVVTLSREQVFEPDVDFIELQIAVGLEGEGRDPVVMRMRVLKAFKPRWSEGTTVAR